MNKNDVGEYEFKSLIGKHYDVIIVGTGLAGLFNALSLPLNRKILIITKDELIKSDSALAQGGISVLKDKNDFNEYFEDTMRAGKYENNPLSVTTMIKYSNEIVEDLISYGVEFDLNSNGEKSFTREGGHSKFRILHHKDITGKEIVLKLIKSIKKRSNIDIYEYTKMVDVLKQDITCKGIVIKDRLGNIGNVFSKYVVLATGGLGGIFNNSTNYNHITGDSMAIAIKNNIEIENINYIQIHPTVLYSKKKGRRFLISESVRGEGAVLVNKEGKEFVNSLLPRDIVTEAIFKEMKKYKTDHVYLDCSKIPKSVMKNHFPNIVERCLEEGINPLEEYIPVTPAQHYIMGGLKTSINGKTSLENLYAIGETACNGVHGANRLASNSLLESSVFAKLAAKEIESKLKKIKEYNTINKTEKFEIYDDFEMQNKRFLWKEIEREDKVFYDKWNNI